MLYTKKIIESIVLKIVGENQLEALGLPRSIEESAILIFIDKAENITNEESQVVKSAMIDIREQGFLPFVAEDDWSSAYKAGQDSYNKNRF